MIYDIVYIVYLYNTFFRSFYLPLKNAIRVSINVPSTSPYPETKQPFLYTELRVFLISESRHWDTRMIYLITDLYSILIIA